MENARGERSRPRARRSCLRGPRSRVGVCAVLLADLTDRKAAESARRRFQDGIVRSHRKVSGAGDAPRNIAVQNLMSSVIENAQLAALEITDGTDLPEVPALLESVRTSVASTAEVLEQLAFRTMDALRKAPGRDGALMNHAGFTLPIRRPNRSGLWAACARGCAPRPPRRTSACMPIRIQRGGGRDDRTPTIGASCAPLRLPRAFRGSCRRLGLRCRRRAVSISKGAPAHRLSSPTSIASASARKSPALPRWIPAAPFRERGLSHWALYVLEGRHLGGIQIARALNGRVGDETGEGRRFFLGRGDRQSACGAISVPRLESLSERPGAGRSWRLRPPFDIRGI